MAVPISGGMACATSVGASCCHPHAVQQVNHDAALLVVQGDDEASQLANQRMGDLDAAAQQAAHIAAVVQDDFDAFAIRLVSRGGEGQASGVV